MSERCKRKYIRLVNKSTGVKYGVLEVYTDIDVVKDRNDKWLRDTARRYAPDDKEAVWEDAVELIERVVYNNSSTNWKDVVYYKAKAQTGSSHIFTAWFETIPQVDSIVVFKHSFDMFPDRERCVGRVYEISGGLVRMEKLPSIKEGEKL